VVQLYVGDPSTAAVPEPPHQLAGFAKVNLRPGQRQRVTLRLTARAFAYWNTGSGAWKVPDGTYQVFVGTSSASLPLSAPVLIVNAKVES
jgi:beta-glucosidase